MNYISDWEAVKKRYMETWAMENHDRPLMNITAWEPRPGSRAPVEPAGVEQYWLDFDYVLKRQRFFFENTFYAGEAYPLFCPNLGPDIFGAVLGADLRFTRDTSWSTHCDFDWKDFKPVYDRQNTWVQKILGLTQAAVDDSRGDYFVGITDIHAGMDALVSLKGPEQVCFDMMDEPEDVQPIPMKMFEVMKAFYDDLYRITRKNQEGTSNWMSAWHEGRWYVTSCDFISIISPEQFDEFVLEELKAEAAWLDASIFHLDGPQCIRHLDKIMAVDGIQAIQWVALPGQDVPKQWRDLLVHIQEAGKGIHLTIRPEDITRYAEFLKPEGVMFNTGVATKEDALDLLKLTERAFFKKSLF